jgi:hypothetical protein
VIDQEPLYERYPVDSPPLDASEVEKSSLNAFRDECRNSSDASGVGSRNSSDASGVDSRNSLNAFKVDNSSRLSSEDARKLANRAACKSLARDQRNPVALVQTACVSEKVYSAEANEDLRKLILRIQLNDNDCKEHRLSDSLAKSKVWTVDPEGTLRFKGRLFIPAGEDLRQRIMSLYHDDPLAGHFGPTRTETLLKRKFHWPNIYTDIIDFVRKCPIC